MAINTTATILSIFYKSKIWNKAIINHIGQLTVKYDNESIPFIKQPINCREMGHVTFHTIYGNEFLMNIVNDAKNTYCMTTLLLG